MENLYLHFSHNKIFVWENGGRQKENGKMRTCNCEIDEIFYCLIFMRSQVTFTHMCGFRKKFRVNDKRSFD